MSERINIVIDEEIKIEEILGRIKATHSDYFKLSNYMRGLETKVAELEKPDCVWTQEFEGEWNGTCGISWGFIDDGPTENQCNFCPKCGGKLIEEQP